MKTKLSKVTFCLKVEKKTGFFIQMQAYVNKERDTLLYTLYNRRVNVCHNLKPVCAA